MSGGWPGEEGRARPRVVVADDHVPTREQVAGALTDAGWEVVGQAGDAQTAVDLVTLLRPDVVLLDVRMPGSGLWAAERLASGSTPVAVVMLTQSDADDDVFDALRAGADGYLLKGDDPARLGAALDGVLTGVSPMSATVVTRILQEFRAPSRRRFPRRQVAAADRLSAREWDVMTLLEQGLRTDQVARRLFISPTTVRVHVNAVVRKLRVPDRAAAIDALRGATPPDGAGTG